MKETRDELQECMDGYISEIEREITAPFDVAHVGFDVGGKILSHTPQGPPDDALTAGLLVTEILTEGGIIPYIEQQKRENVAEILGQRTTATETYDTEIDVWQSGISPDEFTDLM